MSNFEGVRIFCLYDGLKGLLQEFSSHLKYFEDMNERIRLIVLLKSKMKPISYSFQGNSFTMQQVCKEVKLNNSNTTVFWSKTKKF